MCVPGHPGRLTNQMLKPFLSAIFKHFSWYNFSWFQSFLLPTRIDTGDKQCVRWPPLKPDLLALLHSCWIPVLGGAEFWQKLLLRPKTRAGSCVYSSLELPCQQRQCQPSLAPHSSVINGRPWKGRAGETPNPYSTGETFIPRQYFYSWPVASPPAVPLGRKQGSSSYLLIP